MTETIDIKMVDITFGRISMTLPKTIKALATARRLLDMVEEAVVEESRPSSIEQLEATTKKAETHMQPVKLDTRDDIVVQGKETEPGFESPAASSDISKGDLTNKILSKGDLTKFVFKECEPFKWFNLPTFRSGKTIYHLDGGRVHIMREGYADGLNVYVNLNDLRYLHDHPDVFRELLKPLGKNKPPIITGFLRDVDLSKLGCDEHRISKDENKAKKTGQRSSAAEIEPGKCPECGSTKRWSSGKAVLKDGTYRKWECVGCGKIYRGVKIVDDITPPKTEPEQDSNNQTIAQTDGGKPIEFTVVSGADGSEITSERMNKPMFIPDFKNRKQRVEEMLVAGKTREEIAAAEKGISEKALDILIAAIQNGNVEGVG